MNDSSRLVFPHSGSQVTQFEKEQQSRRPWMAFPEITLNSLVDGKAMLSTSTSTNCKNQIIFPKYFPSILNFTFHLPRTHLSGANESDDPYGLYPLRCLACRDLQRAFVGADGWLGSNLKISIRLEKISPIAHSSGEHAHSSPSSSLVRLVNSCSLKFNCLSSNQSYQMINWDVLKNVLSPGVLRQCPWPLIWKQYKYRLTSDGL